MSNAQPLPTVEELTKQITNLIIARAQAKDQIEAIEKQIPMLQVQLQLLNAIAAKEVVTD